MNRHIINENATLLEALGMLNAISGEAMTLFAVDDAGAMTGTLTDGDIRRGLLDGASPDWAVRRVMRRDFCRLSADDVDLALLRDYRERGLRLIPLLKADRHISRVLDLSVTRTLLPLTAILMAGGRGERLRPLTLTTPKPLLKIGGKAIIDYNIENLARAGIDDIYVTVNYLADSLEEHFAQPVGGVGVKCVREPAFYGTIGSARLVDVAPGGTTLVMNSDLLTDISFEEMYMQHKASGADITVASIPYNVAVPFAILQTEGDRVVSLQEKPSYNFYANAGIYMIANELLRSLPEGKRTDATDLLEQAIAQGRKVTYFPIHGTWIDIGSPADYERAQSIMHHRNMRTN